jgi:hypothetical protein
MMLKTTTSLALAATCLAAIATMPANAQMSGSYGSTPGYTGAPGYPGGIYPNAPVPGTYVTQPNQGNIPSSSAGTSGAALMTNGPQASQSDMSSSPSARQNVIQSQRYDRALETNRGFRQARMRKECGPIIDPQLRQSCLASFNADEPSKGSSGSHHHRKHIS